MRGHVRKRGTKWCFVLDVGRDDNGKRVQRWFSGFRTKREAEKAMAARIQEIETGGYVIADKETISSYMIRWLEDKKSQIRYYTYKKYAWLIQRHIIPNLGEIELDKLKPTQLQKFYSRLAEGENGLSKRSILHAHRILHEALDRAVKWGLVGRNVVDAVEPPRAESYHSSVWTPEQATLFMDKSKKLESRYWIAFVIGIMTGMRQAEILGLKWSDVDWDNAFIRVQRTMNYIDHKPVFKELKTERSRRSVALSPDTISALKVHKAAQSQERLLLGTLYQGEDTILTNETGGPLSQNTLNNAWQRALKAIDVPRIRFHDLRHTHASLMLAQGVHPKIVSERLGHATVGITLDTYSHVLPSLQQTAASEFDTLLKPSKKTL